MILAGLRAGPGLAGRSAAGADKITLNRYRRMMRLQAQRAVMAFFRRIRVWIYLRIKD